jgi:hypothetical protein
MRHETDYRFVVLRHLRFCGGRQPRHDDGED